MTEKRRYGITPILDNDPMLTGFDWAVWSALSTFGDWDIIDGRPVMKIGTCFPSLPKLARRAHISVRSVQYALRRLEAAGYVGIDVRWDEKGGRTSNYYSLYPVPVVTTAEKVLPNENRKEPE